MELNVKKKTTIFPKDLQNFIISAINCCYAVILPAEKYLATVKKIEPGLPPNEIREPPKFVQDSGDIMIEMKKRIQECGVLVIRYLELVRWTHSG
jgi:hypothetical protein